MVNLHKGWSLADMVFEHSNLITFYSSLMLFFSLAVVRILIMRGRLRTNGTRIAMIMIAVSWIVTILIITLHKIVSIPDYSKYPVPSAIQSLIILLIGISTLAMNFYIVTVTIKIRVNHPVQASANLTAILLFANCFFNSLFPLTVNGYFLAMFFSGKTCSAPGEISTWFNYFVCSRAGRHRLELVFLLAQALGNNIILLLQRYSRAELKYCWQTTLCSCLRAPEEDYI